MAPTPGHTFSPLQGLQNVSFTSPPSLGQCTRLALISGAASPGAMYVMASLAPPSGIVLALKAPFGVMTLWCFPMAYWNVVISRWWNGPCSGPILTRRRPRA